jgi:uncharacterized protein YegL
MRRLPIYFVLDVSESMVGENIKKLDEGLNSIVRRLRQDPHALETVYISVIAFAGKAKTIVPLIEVASFYPPRLPIGGGTSLGGALFYLMAELDKSVVKTTSEQKGDWKPIIYLITDGKPTDSVNSAIAKWKSEYANQTTFVAISLGRFADIAVLKQITENVMILENTSDEDFKKFIAWVTDSVKSQSKSVSDTSTDSSNFAKFDESVLTMVKDDVSNLLAVDPDYVIITARCQRTRAAYLMKYERNVSIGVLNYMISGSYPIEDEYFAFSDGISEKLKVNTSELLGTPSCPHCGNNSGFGMCKCGGIMCMNESDLAICPWCETEIYFDASNGDNGFDINRARG